MSEKLIKRSDALKEDFIKGFVWGLGLGCGLQVSVLIAAFILWQNAGMPQ
jgi:hypothetical protein